MIKAMRSGIMYINGDYIGRFTYSSDRSRHVDHRNTLKLSNFLAMDHSRSKRLSGSITMVMKSSSTIDKIIDLVGPPKGSAHHLWHLVGLLSRERMFFLREDFDLDGVIYVHCHRSKARPIRKAIKKAYRLGHFPPIVSFKFVFESHKTIRDSNYFFYRGDIEDLYRDRDESSGPDPVLRYVLEEVEDDR